MPDSWKLKRTKQCAKCPWRKDVNPRNIPNGYSEEKHRALRSTIARPGDLSALTSNKIRVMASHETHKTLLALAGSPINSEPETISLFDWICCRARTPTKSVLSQSSTNLLRTRCLLNNGGTSTVSTHKLRNLNHRFVSSR